MQVFVSVHLVMFPIYMCMMNHRHLEAAVRELTEDEEDESSKFSVEELAIILDMDEEEIRDVLRLTGDDK